VDVDRAGARAFGADYDLVGVGTGQRAADRVVAAVGQDRYGVSRLEPRRGILEGADRRRLGCARDLQASLTFSLKGDRS